MDKTKENRKIFRSEQFRTPLAAEKKLGLWIDRIGQATNVRGDKDDGYRILGLYAVICVEDGEGCYRSLKPKKLRVGKGDVMLVHPKMACTYCPDSVWMTKWIVWGGHESVKYEEGFYDPKCPLVKGGAFIVAEAWRQISQIINGEDFSSVIERNGILLKMFAELGRLAKNHMKHDKGMEVFERVRNEIHGGGHEDPRLVEIASDSGLSVTHFRRLFRDFTGTTPKEYIISAKISRAKELLAAGNTIKETADALGYNDVFYFMRVFKKTTGVTAGNFSYSFSKS